MLSPRATDGTKLFSTLTLAVSSLPRSNSVAISRLELFACASFFSWSVRRRWIDRLVGWDVDRWRFAAEKSNQVPCLNLRIMSKVGGEGTCRVCLTLAFAEFQVILPELLISNGRIGDSPACYHS